MKTLKLFILILAIFVFTPVAYTQDYEYYLKNARICITNGDLDAAKRNYFVYKKLTNKTDQALEQMISEYGSDTSLTPEDLKSAGFRFLKENNKVTVIDKADNRKSTIYNVGSHLSNNLSYYGGRVSNNGLFNRVILINQYVLNIIP